MEKRRRISIKELAAMTWTALLAPAVGVLPGVTAKLAGAAGWCSTLIALPILLLAGLGTVRLTKGGTQGLAGAYDRTFGPVLGRGVVLLYLLWALALLAVRLRLSGERLLQAGRAESGPWLFILVLAAMALWLAWDRLAAFARTAELLFVAPAVTLGAVLVLTVPRLRLEHLWPLWWGDMLPALESAVPAVGILCTGIYSAFLLDDAAPRPEDRRRWGRWTAGGCLALTAMQLSVLGCFGPELTKRLGVPLLTLAKSVGVEGAFQRAEGLAAALWLLCDLVMAALLLWAVRRMGTYLCPAAPPKLVAAGAALLALVGAVRFRDVWSAQSFEQTWAPAGGLVMGLFVPCAALLMDKLRHGGGESKGG